MDGKVTIINFNTNADSIVSAAGRISTTKGCADEIYSKSCDNDSDKNIRLIEKILSSGHESILEHIYINLSFNNVSVFVEQFLIEFRLASFTVKSRRYVDFGKMGYIVPDFSESENKDKLRRKYEAYMDFLFDEYNFLIDKGIPKEDARFVLPYSFKSNFYCSVNARELIKIMNEMVFGRGKRYPELVMLGNMMFAQCIERIPFLNIKKEQPDVDEQIKNIFCLYTQKTKTITNKEDRLVSLIQGPKKPEKIICETAALNYGFVFEENCDLPDAAQQDIIKELLKKTRRRELEQVHFTIRFNKISLAGLTHLVRHRMQSIVIPELISVCDYDKYVMPDSVVQAGLRERYQDTFTKSKELAKELSDIGLAEGERVYLLLSGMTMPVITTMNANELYTFIRLRTCNRAQWEIKGCGDALLSILRKEYPVLFSLYGPTCYLTGRCSEGKMTCGRMEEVCQNYGIGRRLE